jgi:hypothetical protein
LRLQLEIGVWSLKIDRCRLIILPARMRAISAR